MESKKNSQSQDTRVPRLLMGMFVHNSYHEPIQIEYRYDIQAGFDIFTRIQDQDFFISGKKYFEAMSQLLDQLPLSSKIMIRHLVMITRHGKREIVELKEYLFPYEVRNASTVTYQINISAYGKDYETHPSLGLGGSGGTYGGALEELRRLINNEFVLNICYFCKHLVDVNEDGGTDYRHDQLYCLRDKPEIAKKTEKMYPHLRDAETLLNGATGNVSALHSCSAFSYQEKPRP